MDYRIVCLLDDGKKVAIQNKLVWKNLVSDIMVKIKFDQWFDLLGFVLSLYAVTVNKYQQLSNILVWKNLVGLFRCSWSGKT